MGVSWSDVVLICVPPMLLVPAAVVALTKWTPRPGVAAMPAWAFCYFAVVAMILQAVIAWLVLFAR